MLNHSLIFLYTYYYFVISRGIMSHLREVRSYFNVGNDNQTNSSDENLISFYCSDFMDCLLQDIIIHFTSRTICIKVKIVSDKYNVCKCINVIFMCNNLQLQMQFDAVNCASWYCKLSCISYFIKISPCDFSTEYLGTTPPKSSDDAI